jgi:hypothetical protein
MPKIRNATRAGAISFAKKVAECEETGMSVYAAPGEGTKVWYIRPIDHPAPPRCIEVAQIQLAPSETQEEEA